MKIVKDIE